MRRRYTHVTFSPRRMELRGHVHSHLPPPMTTTRLPVKSGITSSPMELCASPHAHAHHVHALSSPGMPTFLS